MPTEGPVFVTGGTGYIGSRVVQRLIAEGVAVRAVVRSLTGQQRLEAMGVDFAQLGSPELFAPMRQAIHQCRLAVHLAGAMVEERGNRFNGVNVIAGRMFARVAKEQAVAKAVLVTCVGSERSARIRSQRVAEDAMREAGTPFTILRLAPVYGPGSRLSTWLTGIAHDDRRIPASGEARWRPLHVDDAVEAILRVLDPETATGEVVEVGGGESLPLRRFGERFGVRGAAGLAADGRQGWLSRLRKEEPARAPLPVADLELTMDPGPGGAERLGFAPRMLAEGLA